MDITLIIELVLFAVLMGLSAFFSSSETALFSLDRMQLEQMRRSGNVRTPLIERMLSQPRQLIVTILIGNELVNVAASVISAAIVIRVLGAESKWINLLIMVPVLLLVGEITPKTLAIQNNVAFATVQSRFVDLFARLITPLRWLVRHIAGFFITLIVGEERSRANIITEDMVRSLAAEAVGDGVLDREEAQYINRIFDFGDKTLRDIMTPRSQIFYLPADASLEDAAAAYQRTGHTKIPVFDKQKDSIVGLLYTRDLLTAGALEEKPATISGLLRDAYFVPESKSVADLFYTFRRRKRSLALTVDEYGGVTGLVTMEDVLECIFGDILSRSEALRQREIAFHRLAEGRYRIDGSMTIDHFNQLLGTNFATDAAETMGGLLLDAFGELPRAGRRAVIDGLSFTVETVTRQRITAITVAPGPSADVEGEPGEAVSAAAPPDAQTKDTTGSA